MPVLLTRSQEGTTPALLHEAHRHSHPMIGRWEAWGQRGVGMLASTLSTRYGVPKQDPRQRGGSSTLRHGMGLDAVDEIIKSSILGTHDVREDTWIRLCKVSIVSCRTMK
mmetsp:Transcript_2094/g.4802  ORF Transcript_2094/g.4802 Transcript_2094/m.4802 type:complete len:110 (+) Transcript_2094:44-373(+)